MLKLHNVVCLFVHFCGYILPAKAIPCRGTATYKLQFQAEWKNTSSRPAGAKFSGLIGCVHNKCYQMWKEGERASRGVKNVAEKGDWTVLESEILKHLEKWKTARERLQSKNNIIGPEAQVIIPDINDENSGFTVDSSRPLVSIIAKIIPSPDLFIGVHDINLCNKSGNWIQHKRITLFPYDAGTARQSRQSALNDTLVEPASPQQDITLVEDSFISVRGMGYMRFSFINKFERAHVVDIDEDNCPNEASLKKLSSLMWLAMIVTILIKF